MIQKIIQKGLATLILTAGFVSCQQDDFYHSAINAPTTGEMTLNFVSDPMQQYNVTRSSDPKDEDEKRINQLYIFFFDNTGEYLKGGYLTGYPDASDEGGFYAPGEGVTLLKIDHTQFTDKSKAEHATIYAVANLPVSLFNDDNEDGLPDNFPNQSALENYIYTPTENVSLGIPQGGMPMIGKKANLNLTSLEENENKEERTIELTALMARIDVNIKLNSSITDNNLPALTLVEWTAKNLPTKVPFTVPTTTGTGWDDWGKDNNPKDITTPMQRTIYNRNGEIEFSFYLYENIQQNKKIDWDSNYPGITIDKNTGYPAGVYDEAHGIDRRQNYKPLCAADPDNSAAVELHAFYSTYNDDGTGSATYEVRYTLYLGSNHTDNFEVKRNHQYKNNITITGLTRAGNNPEHITFDTRVNITEQDNEFYIAMLRERNHDAHFCVTPMDVYLFADASAQPTMEVILGEVPDNSEAPTAETVPDWIRMERIPAGNMENGSVPATLTSTNLATGQPWYAGNGKRKYFTTNLLSDLAESGKHVTIENTRDRVYFYLDENLSATTDRDATVTLIYKENGQEVKRRTILIEQTHFLPVTYTEYYDDRITGLIKDYFHTDPQNIYMEAYEEYLDHYDPLNEYQTNQIYDGLQWGLNGVTINDINVTRFVYWPGLFQEQSGYENFTINAKDNYYQGLEFTNQIINDARTHDGYDETEMTLNTTPRSAAEYCYNRNKRNTDGTVSNANKKWFLPAIRQMEEALTQYYTKYNEFQSNFYWSSSAAKTGNDGYRQDTGRARATKVKDDGSGYVESNEDQQNYYPNGGNAERNEYLRIRAFRIDLNPTSN